jgi:hypothetical protein
VNTHLGEDLRSCVSLKSAKGVLYMGIGISNSCSINSNLSLELYEKRKEERFVYIIVFSGVS